ncbi:MAG: hypothetical protein R3A52_33255, partial [Polyangiales bacterium]
PSDSDTDAARVCVVERATGREVVAVDAGARVHDLAWAGDEALLVVRETHRGRVLAALHAVPDGGVVASRDVMRSPDTPLRVEVSADHRRVLVTPIFTEVESDWVAVVPSAPAVVVALPTLEPLVKVRGLALHFPHDEAPLASLSPDGARLVSFHGDTVAARRVDVPDAPDVTSRLTPDDFFEGATWLYADRAVLTFVRGLDVGLSGSIALDTNSGEQRPFFVADENGCVPERLRLNADRARVAGVTVEADLGDRPFPSYLVVADASDGRVVSLRASPSRLRGLCWTSDDSAIITMGLVDPFEGAVLVHRWPASEGDPVEVARVATVSMPRPLRIAPVGDDAVLVSADDGRGARRTHALVSLRRPSAP